jgi:hypothetical protein
MALPAYRGELQHLVFAVLQASRISRRSFAIFIYIVFKIATFIVAFTSKRTTLSLVTSNSRLFSLSRQRFNPYNINKKEMTSKGCCPPNAHKYLAPDYKHVGNILTLEDGTEIYRTGDPSSKKAVLLIPDIFGWNGGRTRNIADFLAENGYYTVIPKLLIPPVDGGTDGDGFTKLDDFQAFFATLRERFSYDSK